MKIGTHTIARARGRIMQAETDLKRKLTDGERRDLLKDTTTWSNDEINHIVKLLTTKQARFWVYFTSPVRIKLNKGQTLCHYHGGPTDEGWYSESNIWSFDGTQVSNEWIQDGRDCDGRIEHMSTCVCPLNKLAAGYAAPDEPGIQYPRWKDVCHSQRDHSAEAMGY